MSLPRANHRRSVTVLDPGSCRSLNPHRSRHALLAIVQIVLPCQALEALVDSGAIAAPRAFVPGQIQPATSDILVSNYDFLPSVLEQLGLKHRIPKQPELPGRSYAAVLRGETIEWETAMFYEMEGCRSVRTERWKYVARREPDGPGELYDMAGDPHERFNLYGQEQHADVQRQMAERLDAFFARYADPQYDIWKGGASKARRLYAPPGHPDYRPLRPR